jgi:hypothetical protein
MLIAEGFEELHYDVYTASVAEGTFVSGSPSLAPGAFPRMKVIVEKSRVKVRSSVRTKKPARRERALKGKLALQSGWHSTLPAR